MALERPFGFPRSQVPNSQGVVPEPETTRRPSGAIGHSSHAVGMTLERSLGIPRSQIPNSQRNGRQIRRPCSGHRA
jgi:hypothetical protein